MVGIKMKNLSYFLKNFDGIDKIFEIEGVDSDASRTKRNSDKLKYVYDRVMKDFRDLNGTSVPDRQTNFMYFHLYNMYGSEFINNLSKLIVETYNGYSYYKEDFLVKFINIVEKTSFYNRAKLVADNIEFMNSILGDKLYDTEDEDYDELLIKYQENLVALNYEETIRRNLNSFYIPYHLFFRYIIFWGVVDDKTAEYYKTKTYECGYNTYDFIVNQLEERLPKTPKGTLRIYLTTLEKESREIIRDFFKNEPKLNKYYTIYKNELDN